MKSYIKRVAFLVCSVIACLVILNGGRLIQRLKNQIVSVDVISPAQIEKLIAGKEYRESEPRLVFNDAKAAYDKNTGTLYLPQNLSSESLEGSLKTAEKDCHIYFREDEQFEKKAEAISTGHGFELIALRDTEYCTYSVVFTGMPVMNITTENVSKEEEETLWSGKLQVYDPYRSSARFQQADCSYHIRGGSSEHYEKPNYKLNLLDKDLSLLGMRKDDDWILNSLYDDAGLVHNKISFQIWREIAARNEVSNDEGVTAEYLELFIDNEYRGVYLLTERPDKKTLSLGENDILYKCRADRIPEEHNYTNENTDEMRPIFVLKYPKEPEEEDWEPLKDWVDAFCKLELSGYEEGESLLNMENAIDYNLFALLICGVDNMRKNVYLIAEYQEDGNYRFKKVPWDMNASWGNFWLDNEASNNTLYDTACIEDVNTWCTDISTLYFYGETKIAGQLKERWKQLRDEGVITREKLKETADAQFEYLHNSGAYDRNYTRWTNGAEYWQDEYIYAYMDGRIDFLDSYFENLYEETLLPALYDGIDYSDEFEVRFYWERYRKELSEWYPYDRQQLLGHYIQYGLPFGLHGRQGAEYPDDWKYIYGPESE